MSKKDDSKTGLKKTDSKSSDKTDKQDSKVDEAVEKIAGGLKESLGLTDDELETIMQQMGLSMNDLLNPAVLTQIFTQYKEVDQASLLTDQNLSDQLRDLLNLVNEAVEDASGAANDENYKLIDDLIANPAAEEDLSGLKDMGQDKTDAKEELDLKETADQKSDFVETFAKKTSVEVKSDSNTSDSDSYMNQSQNAQVDDIPNQVYNMASSVASNFEEALDAISSDVNPVEVAKQVVEQAKVVVTKQMSSIEMVLNPESLGRVNLMVTMKQEHSQLRLLQRTSRLRRHLRLSLFSLRKISLSRDLRLTVWKLWFRPRLSAIAIQMLRMAIIQLLMPRRLQEDCHLILMMMNWKRLQMQASLQVQIQLIISQAAELIFRLNTERLKFVKK